MLNYKKPYSTTAAIAYALRRRGGAIRTPLDRRSSKGVELLHFGELKFRVCYKIIQVLYQSCLLGPLTGLAVTQRRGRLTNKMREAGDNRATNLDKEISALSYLVGLLDLRGKKASESFID